MPNQFNSNFYNISFLEIYQTEIAPQLESIDILLKSMDEPLSAKEAANALNISEQEVNELVFSLGICEIDHEAFLHLMRNASSPICKLFQRETAAGSPYLYTQQDVAFIYGLPIDDVSRAFEELGVKAVTAFTLPDLFGHLLQPSPLWAHSTN